MSDLRFLLAVSRPRFWFYVFGPYLIGVIAGAASRNELANWRVILFGLYFLLPANLLVYGINDIFDYETDRLNAKKESYETLIDPGRRRWVFYWIVGLNLPAVIAAAILFDPLSFTALQSFIFLSIFYSSPPIRAKTKPFLDSAFNVLYIMPGVFGFTILSGTLAPVTLIVAAGCWTAAMHAYSAIPDIGADRKARLRTIATVCGPFGTLGVCIVLYNSAAILSFEYLGLVSISLGFAYLILMLASIQSVRSGRLFKLYRAFPYINVAAGFVLFWQIALDKFF